MAYAINIRSDDASSELVKSIWQAHEQLEEKPSMQMLGYAPHITFAIYNEVAPEQLHQAFDYAFDKTKAVILRFEDVKYFESPQGFVLWLKPLETSSLLAIHQKIHEVINPALCREHYRPDSWVPHCSTATAVTLPNKSKMLSVVEQGIQPFEVVFDVADYVSFIPVEILHEKHLAQLESQLGGV